MRHTGKRRRQQRIETMEELRQQVQVEGNKSTVKKCLVLTLILNEHKEKIYKITPNTTK